jgi:glyoxylate/hydroxypyruvate reductase
MIDVVIASFLEDEHVARICAGRDGVRVHNRPDLLPPPRYVADHTGAPFERDAAAEAEWRELLARAHVLFDFDYLRPRNLVEHAPQLRWVQATSAGIGEFVRRHGLEGTGVAFTTAAGTHGRPLAEFVLWATLCFAKNYPQARVQQREESWRRFHGSEILGSTLVMVGMGGIGRSVAALMRPLGVRVVGVKREVRPGDAEAMGVEALLPFTRIDEVLGEADHLVLACPLTPETEGMLDAARLARLKRGAVVINIGRGRLLDPTALVAAIDAGALSGAVLDVTDPEPLPAGHPLWRHERVIVFPHSASTSVRENERLTELFCDNLDRFVAGRPLRNLYDHGRGY